MAEIITRTKYKAYRGISNSNDDARIDAIIPGVSSLIRTYCGKSFNDYVSTNKVEKFSLKWLQQVVFLTESPIIEIVSVEEILEGETSYTALAANEYMLDESLDAVYRIDSGVRTNFPIGINSVKVTYKGGYATLPTDLEIAACDLVTYYYKDQYLPEKNHASFTIRYNADAPDFPAHIKRVLDMYKNV